MVAMAETVTYYAALPNIAAWPVQEKQEDAEEEEGKSTEEGGSSTPTRSCLSRSSTECTTVAAIRLRMRTRILTGPKFR